MWRPTCVKCKKKKDATVKSCSCGVLCVRRLCITETREVKALMTETPKKVIEWIVDAVETSYRGVPGASQPKAKRVKKRYMN